MAQTIRNIDRYHDFQPGNGTRYGLTLVDDPHGGVLVVWPTIATYRWYPKYGELKYLHGAFNKFDMKAIQTYLNRIAKTIGVLQ